MSDRIACLRPTRRFPAESAIEGNHHLATLLTCSVWSAQFYIIRTGFTALTFGLSSLRLPLSIFSSIITDPTRVIAELALALSGSRLFDSQTAINTVHGRGNG